VLFEIFPEARNLYLNLNLRERERFDRQFNTLFFMHAATQPVINAEKLLALMQAGMVSIVRLGSDYRFERNGSDGPFDFIYQGPQGDLHRDTYPYAVNACGQPRSQECDTSQLTQNLIKRGLIQLEESRDAHVYRTGSIVVDPETHRVIRHGSDSRPLTEPSLFAVGAMTRGQMIDASMAYGITRATARVADEVISALRRQRRQP
jgi:hypothetical protein